MEDKEYQIGIDPAKPGADKTVVQKVRTGQQDPKVVDSTPTDVSQGVAEGRCWIKLGAGKCEGCTRYDACEHEDKE